MALFGVELNGKNVIFRHRTSKRKGISTVARRIGVSGFDIVAVHEIKARIIGNVFPEGMLNRLMDLVPTHVRHLELLSFFIFHCACGKTLHPSWHDAEAGYIALFAAVEQHLQTDADTQEWFVGGRIPHGFAQSAPVQFMQAVRHGALSGNDHALRLPHYFRVIGNSDDSLGGDMFECQEG